MLSEKKCKTKTTTRTISYLKTLMITKMKYKEGEKKMTDRTEQLNQCVVKLSDILDEYAPTITELQEVIKVIMSSAEQKLATEWRYKKIRA